MNLVERFAAPATSDALRGLWPGLLLAGLIAVSASFVAEHHGGPAFLYALLLGMAFHFLSAHERCAAGIDLAAKQLVRLGVVLLGMRIVVADVEAIGFAGLSALAGAVGLSVGCGLLLARWLGLSSRLGLLSGGATGICGISAALALAAVMPPGRETERYTLVTAVGVATLSTVAMVLYPLLVNSFGLGVDAAGLFLGGSIHDVSQVVGAGFMISAEVGESATLAKMFRVALLAPVVLAVAFAYRRQRLSPQGRFAQAMAVMPGFLVAFVLVVLVNSLGWIPEAASAAGAEISRWCLLIAISALGVKTSLQQIAELGWRCAALLLGEAIAIAAYMLVVAVLLPGTL